MISQTFREVILVPSPSSRHFIGADLSFEPWESAHENVFMVDDILKGSPAENAGLNMEDYVIGAVGNTMFRGVDEVEDWLWMWEGKAVHMVVYSEGVVRVVEITPKRDWGGRGILGCKLLHGEEYRIDRPSLEEMA